MANDTMKKFGYPDSLIKEYGYWVLLLRPAQVTLGSMVLAAKSDATSYSQLPKEAFAEQHAAIADIESAMAQIVSPQKMNYLMLMMVDPHVHFHVIPRYEGSRTFENVTFPDSGWPGPPALGQVAETDKTTMEKLKAAIASNLC